MGIKKGRPIINLIRQEFDRLRVIALSDKRLPGFGGRLWQCKCVCGNICIKSGTELRRKLSVSCGCHKLETPISATKEKIRWYALRNYAKRKHLEFHKEWLIYSVFAKWVADNRPDDSYRLRRLNRNKGLTPDNCKYVKINKKEEA